MFSKPCSVRKRSSSSSGLMPASRRRKTFRISSSSKTIDVSLVPSGAAMEKLLTVFELEKAVYELSYELNNRPDWVRIPVAGIVRLLDEEVPV